MQMYTLFLKRQTKNEEKYKVSLQVNEFTSLQVYELLVQLITPPPSEGLGEAPRQLVSSSTNIMNYELTICHHNNFYSSYSSIAAR